MAAGILGSADLGAAADTLLYTVPASTVTTLNIRASNRNSSAIKVRVAVGTGGAPAATNYIDYDVAVGANGILEDTGIVCSAGEKVWVRSDLANVSVRVYGFEEAA